MAKVSRVECTSYAGVEEAIRKSVELIGGPHNFVKPDEALLIKPNLLAPHKVSEAVTTHPAVVEAVIKIALEMGARVTVGDSPGLYGAHRVAKACGILEVCDKYSVPVVNLGDTGFTPLSGSTFKSIEIANEALDAGTVWNLPKWKTHTMMGLTLGIKNLYGCIPGKKKALYHFRAGKSMETFAALLLDIWQLVDPSLTILDGVTAMEGAGPARGTPLERNLILASGNAAALDHEATRLSGFKVEGVPTLKATVKTGHLDPKKIEVAGDEIKPMKFAPAPGSPVEFTLIPKPIRGIFRRAISPFPHFKEAVCTACGVCIEACPTGAIALGEKAAMAKELCIRCYCCQELCPVGAVTVPKGPGRFFT